MPWTGPGPYSHALRGAGLLFVSGQPAGPTMAEQAEQAFANLAVALRAGGSRPDLVETTTVLVADTSRVRRGERQFAAFFPVDPPTRMTMRVTLPLGLLISIGCTALLAD